MTRFAFVDAERAHYPVAVLCRCLRVSRSGYYAWARRGPSPRAVADAVLTEQISALHAASRGTYGAPRVHADLAEAGVHVGRKRVARLMRAHGLHGVSRRRRGGCTQADPLALAADRPADLVNRSFTATAPNQLWVADVTYVPTTVGWLYLAVVLEVFSRMVLGWSMAGHRKTDLVCDAVAMAVARRGGHVAGVIHHSDQGSEYTSHDLARALRHADITASMGSVADCYDNAMAESFFASLETELFAQTRFTSHRQAKLAIFDYIETFYNRQRRHSALGYQTPASYELTYQDQLVAS